MMMTANRTGTADRYAPLYHAASPYPTFYLPDAVAPRSISSRPAAHDFVVPRQSAKTAQQDEKSDDDVPSPARLLVDLPEVDQPTDTSMMEESLEINLLTHLRNHNNPDADAEPDEASQHARALLTHLEQTAQMDTLTQAIGDAEKEVGLDVIRLMWRVAPTAQKNIGQMLREDGGLLTLESLHECGMKFTLLVQLAWPAQSTPTTVSNAVRAEHDEIVSLASAADTGNAACFPRIHATSASGSNAASHWAWMLLEYPTACIPLRRARQMGWIDASTAYSQLRAVVSVLRSAKTQNEEGELEAETSRGRSAAQPSQGAKTITKERADSAVAGLGFSPQDDRRPPPSSSVGGASSFGDAARAFSGQQQQQQRHGRRSDSADSAASDAGEWLVTGKMNDTYARAYEHALYDPVQRRVVLGVPLGKHGSSA